MKSESTRTEFMVEQETPFIIGSGYDEKPNTHKKFTDNQSNNKKSREKSANF